VNELASEAQLFSIYILAKEQQIAPEVFEGLKLTKKEAQMVIWALKYGDLEQTREVMKVAENRGFVEEAEGIVKSVNYY